MKKRAVWMIPHANYHINILSYFRMILSDVGL